MNMLDLMNKLTQLSEATKDTGKGKIHTADPGGYGRKEDEDEAGEDGKKKKAKPADAPRGRGRPKKDADSSGEVKKYDFTAFGAPAKGKDVKLPKWDKSKTSKHTPMKDAEKSEKKKEKSSLKDWIEHYEILALNEAEQIQIKPASQMPKKPGVPPVGAKPGQPAPVTGVAPTNTQVIAQGDKTLGTVNNPALAQQIKQSIGKGEMTLMPDQAMSETSTINGKVQDPSSKVWKQTGLSPAAAIAKYGKANVKVTKGGLRNGSDMVEVNVPLGEAKKAKPDFLDLDKDGDKKEPMKKASTDKKNVKEGELPVHDGDAGAGLGAGRNPKVLEKMRTSGKKGLGESMEHRLKAAHHRGKAHALARESYNCKYEDMDESRCYHEGFKEGLDECYGQGVMDEGAMGGVLGALAGGALTKTPGGAMTGYKIGSGLQDAFAGDDEVEEGNAFTGALAHTPQGEKFSVGGRTYTDKSSIEESPWSMNEDAQLKDWDSTLSSLLKEGFNVTSSTGLGGPDSVSINATDADAQELLAIVRQAGLGVFGGDEAQSQDSPVQSSDYGAPQASSEPMTMDAGGEQGGEESHDGMLAMMKKLSGLSGSSEDYADEEGEGSEQEEAACSTCGSSPCGCEAIDEEETMDQREFEVSEDNGDNEEEQSEVSSDATRDAALATAATQNVDEDAEDDEDEDENDDGEGDYRHDIRKQAELDAKDEEEDELEESYANGDDDGFQADIDFMTNVITGGLNKQKSTGQSTIPVVASQENRLGNPMRESTDLLSDWKKLSGI